MRDHWNRIARGVHHIKPSQGGIESQQAGPATYRDCRGHYRIARSIDGRDCSAGLIGNINAGAVAAGFYVAGRHSDACCDGAGREVRCVDDRDAITALVGHVDFGAAGQFRQAHRAAAHRHRFLQIQGGERDHAHRSRTVVCHISIQILAALHEYRAWSHRKTDGNGGNAGAAEGEILR